MMAKASQQGSVLITAMVFLLLLTIAGVTAMRLVQIETQAVGANLARNYAYQAAESGLIRAEEFVHQRMANFGQITFLRQGSAIPSSCDNANQVCFIENTCRNGFCMRGFFDAAVGSRLNNSEPFAFGAHSVFPIAMTPQEISTAQGGDDEGVEWLEARLEEFQDARPWSDLGTETNQWANAANLTVSIPVPDPDTLNAFTTADYNVEYLIEFRGFNLAEGVDPVQAMLPNNLPPSNFWMMTYRVTVKVDENADGESLGSTRAMIQGLYTRQLPRLVDSVLSVNQMLDNSAGSDIAVEYGEFCAAADFAANDLTKCNIPNNVDPVAYDSTNFSSSSVQMNGVDMYDNELASHVQRTARADDQYFGQYFDGQSRQDVLTDPIVPQINSNDLAGGCDFTGESIVVINGDIILDEFWNTGPLGHKGFKTCTFEPDAKVIVTGRLDWSANLPDWQPFLPEIGLLYVMGQEQNTDGDWVDLTSESQFFGSYRLPFMLAIQNDATFNGSFHVRPRNYPFAASSFSSLNGRSRYAWRELDFDG